MTIEVFLLLPLVLRFKRRGSVEPTEKYNMMPEFMAQDVLQNPSTSPIVADGAKRAVDATGAPKCLMDDTSMVCLSLFHIRLQSDCCPPPGIQQ